MLLLYDIIVTINTLLLLPIVCFGDVSPETVTDFYIQIWAA